MRTIILNVFLFVILFTAQAQVGKSIKNVKLTDVTDAPISLPYIGEKVFVLFYIDPDVQDINDPLNDALNAKKFPKTDFGAIGVVNCKDTWIPNNAILAKARQKQERFPASVIMLDKNYILASAWKLGKCDDAAVILIIGKDSTIKFAKTIKSRDESKAIVQTVLSTIENELKK